MSPNIPVLTPVTETLLSLCNRCICNITGVTEHTCTDTDDRVRASLPRGPIDLEDVQSPLVAHHAADAIGGLGDRVPVEGQLVVVLDEDVVRSENYARVELGNIRVTVSIGYSEAVRSLLIH